MERLLRLLENPDIPEYVWRGIKETDDRRLADSGMALTEFWIGYWQPRYSAKGRIVPPMQEAATLFAKSL